MNINDYNYLLNKPDAINEKQTLALEKVLDEFPFFQSARAIRLKGLFNQNSFKYNFALKETAAHTTDRTILFDFISSNSFISIQKALYNKKEQELLDINVVDSETIKALEILESKTSTLEQKSPDSIKENPQTEPEEKLALGKPLDFSKNEKHSFQEWLQLSRTQPIEREEESPNISPIRTQLSQDKIKKAALIDKFIETSPKITPLKHGIPSTANFDLNKDDNAYLMTETLARVYLEQKKYQKAIQAYEILILKYPEKSSFFADHISDIKILQQNNT